MTMCVTIRQTTSHGAQTEANLKCIAHCAFFSVDLSRNALCVSRTPEIFSNTVHTVDLEENGYTLPKIDIDRGKLIEWNVDSPLIRHPTTMI